MKITDLLLYIESYCSKEEIAKSIFIVYTSLNYPIQLYELKAIQEKVISGNYEFSPLRIKFHPLGTNLQDIYPLVLHDPKYPHHVLGVNIQLCDKIVLEAIGSIIQNLISKFHYYDSNSYGIRLSVADFYSNILSSLSNVSILYRLDLKISFNIITQSNVLDSLESLIGYNNDVYTFVEKFLNLPYIDDNDESELILNGISIPPVSILFYILFNLCLNKLDNEIRYKHPSIRYLRYMNEVYIYNCTSINIKDIENILNKLNLKANITYIKPGEQNITCNIGYLNVDKYGKIIYNIEEDP